MNTKQPRFSLFFAALLAVSQFARAGVGPVSPSVPADQPLAEVLGEYVIAQQPGRYIGWPTITRAHNGDLLVVFSGDRDWHVCPWGKTFLVRSTDDGATWGEPVVIFDSPIDDRDAGIVTLPDGTLVVNLFTSLVFAGDHERYAKYKDHAATIDRATRDRWLGNWTLRSRDHGHTWDEPARAPASTPHGVTVLDDGRILFVRQAVHESSDAGLTWTQIATIDKPADFASTNEFLSEQHAEQAADGSIVALSRYQNAPESDFHLRQTVSRDGGRTWSPPVRTGMQGYPADVLRLRNGWLLAAYGRRLAPMGQRAAISKDHGATWLTDQEIVLSNATPVDESTIDYPASWDLGYPSSVELPDGTIWTVYYQVADAADDHKPSLMATHWRPRGE